MSSTQEDKQLLQELKECERQMDQEAKCLSSATMAFLDEHLNDLTQARMHHERYDHFKTKRADLRHRLGMSLIGKFDMTHEVQYDTRVDEALDVLKAEDNVDFLALALASLDQANFSASGQKKICELLDKLNPALMEEITERFPKILV